MTPTRAEQRRQTEARILAAARQMFADLGFDRTTIRAVAKVAAVDAGLVMHYFGSKNELFARAAELPTTQLGPDAPDQATQLGAGRPDQAIQLGAGAPDQAAELGPGAPGQATQLGAGTPGQAAAIGAGRPDQAAEFGIRTPDQVAEALLDSLATRLEAEPTASLAVLRSMLTNADAAARYRTAGESQVAQLTAALPVADADLRANLLSAIIHGVIVERYLLRFGRLADASPEQIIDLLRPCFQALVVPPES
ncbi:TetR/AcrR family transcriptional regulator [Actinoplanes sp. L3-i22]|uniref:TetR/AcrR family transcriptional regulator n=1 Tax=Actinoplanes sp. L3-i22 TaxID=2836373 RepID=UPI001C766C21|nr:TetR/AcrR family transcriptional regulator [Actinoplanes sp. L3-i22]BCY10864.1 hypothetical protein L3i22_059520 [Actinoplanes sp. L3-i22]